MTATLSPEQLQALAATNGRPLRLQDPNTEEAYVLVKAVVYEQLLSVLKEDEGPDMRQVALLVEETMRDYDENDPTLEFYQSSIRAVRTARPPA